MIASRSHAHRTQLAARARRATAVLAVAAAVATAGGLSACAANDPNAPVVDPGQVIVAERGAEIELAAGQSARVPSANLLLTFSKLIGDSRCPTMATIQCVWGGSVVVEVVGAPIVGSGPSQLVRLESLAGKDTATVSGTRVQMLRVLPERRSTDSIPVNAYRIVLRAGTTP